MSNTGNEKRRNVIVSYFEIFPYDRDECFWNGDGKCFGKMSVNISERTITFEHIGGKAPLLLVILLVMSANKRWDKIVDEYYRNSQQDIKNYALITGWNSNVFRDIFLANMGENELPTIEKRSIRIDNADSGIHQCTLTPLEFLLLINENETVHYDENHYRNKLKEARKGYEFRYITDSKAKEFVEQIDETEAEDGFGFYLEDEDDEDFNLSDADFGFEEFDDDFDFSDDLDFDD